MSNIPGDPGQGDSPAAWTAVIVMTLGIALGTVAIFFAQYTLVWVGAGLVVLGLLLGFILSKAGYGVNGPRFVPKSRR